MPSARQARFFLVAPCAPMEYQKYPFSFEIRCEASGPAVTPCTQLPDKAPKASKKPACEDAGFLKPLRAAPAIL
jgi:hypothetical protein